MRTVILHRYWVQSPGRKRPHLTSFPMDAETAAAHYPGAKPEPSTRILRELPETEEEAARAMAHYQSAGRDGAMPPRQ